MKNRLPIHDNWATPPAFYKTLDNEFHFNFDPCPLNHDLSLWNGLEIDWEKRNVYINPPYSQKIKEAFVLKAIEENKKGALCVLLLPVSTSTILFHKYIQPNADEIRFVRGRIPFIGINDKGQRVNYHLIQEVTTEMIEIPIENSDEEVKTRKIPLYTKNSGQHDSMVVIFNKKVS